MKTVINYVDKLNIAGAFIKSLIYNKNYTKEEAIKETSERFNIPKSIIGWLF